MNLSQNKIIKIMEKRYQQNYFCKEKFFIKNILIVFLWLLIVSEKINIFIRKLFIRHKQKFKVIIYLFILSF